MDAVELRKLLCMLTIGVLLGMSNGLIDNSEEDELDTVLQWHSKTMICSSVTSYNA